MNQSTSFAHVATNLLNVLQGYTKGIRLVVVLTMLLTIGVGSMWGETTTYTFTSNKWADSSNGWTSGKDGVAYLNSGVQVTKNGTGAYATSKNSFTNISKIDVKYCTNGSSGAGTIVLTVGSTSKTLTISKNGGTTMRIISASFDPNVSGTIKITVNCTTNSIYIGGITITTVENAKPHTVTLNAGPGTCAEFVTEISAGEGVELPTPTLNGCDEWRFAGWAEQNVEEETNEEPILIPAGTYNPAKDITLYAVYKRTEDGSGGGSSTVTFNFGYKDWGYNAQFSGSTYDEVTQTKEGVTVVYTRHDGSLYANSTSLRFYKSNTLTFDAGSNTITAITFTGSVGQTDITTDANTCTNTSSSLSWSGNSTSVTFTRPSGASGYATLTTATLTISGGSTTYYHSTPDCGTSVPTYTLTNTVSLVGYGTVLPSSVAGIPEGTTTTSSSNTYTVNGTTVTATPTTATAQYTYEFSKWQDLPATVNGNTTVTAVFTRTTNKYTITWKNGDNVLETDNNVEYGVIPQYNGTTPTKAATEQYTYTHNGWTPSVVAVIGDAEYTATFAETPRTYTITLNTNGGTINAGNVTSYKYGAGATLPTDLTKGNLEFAGWYDNEICDGSPVATISTTDTGNKEFWAKWEKSTPTFAWPVASYTAALEADNTFPTLDNPNSLSPVTYTSSNTGVATIDANGNITLIAAGTTTITAAGAETDTHKSATAIYELNVLESNCRWVEVTDNTTLEDGDEVVIAMTDALSNSYTLLNEFPEDKEVPDAIGISSTNSFIDDYIWIVGKDGENLTFESYKNRGNFLRCNNADKGIRIDNTANANRKFVVDDTYGYLKNTQTTKPRYLGVHNEDHTWYSYALTDKGNFPTKIVGQTLKFYKKTCLPANKFWIDYELANVTCTTAPPPFAN